MSLIEIMIVVTVIGLLATLAIPNFRKARARAQNARFINDLRILTDSVFEQYAIENGDYPSDAAPGVVPTGVAPYLASRFDWADGTPIGGEWNWDRANTRAEKVNGAYASLEAVGVSRTSAQMRDIDEQIDDGDLLSGLFRQTAAGYTQILEK
jgi:type II secretory pathway pseudopilin PulG